VRQDVDRDLERRENHPETLAGDRRRRFAKKKVRQMRTKIGLAVVVVVLVGFALLKAKRNAPVAKRPTPTQAQENMDILEKAFVPGTTSAVDGATVSFGIQNLGKLKVPTGQLIACDPLVLMGEKPFARKTPTGEYPVEMAIARIKGDERIAFARIRFSSGQVKKWEMAVTPGQDVSTLKDGDVFGYGVDSGTGSIMDKKAADALQVKMDRDQSYSDRLLAEMKKTYKNTREWALINVGDANAAVFSSGYGDGLYASYWGLDSNGEVVTLVTDFGVVEWTGKR
jgi:hypothetical protein